MSTTPPVNFSQFVVSLASSALVHLGEIAEPGGTKTQVNLGLARHSINVLNMLQEKTKGNLDSEESRLLEAVLGDLSKKIEAASKGD